MSLLLFIYVVTNCPETLSKQRKARYDRSREEVLCFPLALIQKIA